MEQMEMSIKTEVEAAATSPAHCDSEIKQDPVLLQSVKSEPSLTDDALLKEEILADSSPGGSEQQCVDVASTLATTAGVNETCSTSLGDLLNVKYESAEMDIGPTVLQHMDSHYTFNKNMSAATEENAVVVDCNEALPGSEVKKKNIEGAGRDGSEQQCIHVTSTPARTGGVNEGCSTILFDLLNVKYESAEMDIGQTVLQHMDSHYTINKNMSAAADENTVLVDCNEAMPGSGVKKENIEGEWRDDSEQQCVHDASTPASAGGVNETCSTSLGDLLRVKYESAEMDIGPTVLQHMDTHYTIYKNSSATAEENAVVVDCNEAMPGGGVKKNIEGEGRGGREQQCVDVASTSASTGAVNDLWSMSLVDLLKVKYKSAEMDIGPTVLQHMNSHYTIHKNMSAVAEENAVVVDCNEAMPGGGMKKNIEGEGRGDKATSHTCNQTTTAVDYDWARVYTHPGQKDFQKHLLHQHRVCEKGCSSKADLNLDNSSHSSVELKNQLGNYESQTRRKQDNCDCGTKFEQRGDLIKNMGVHTGEKPYKCKLCDARFVNSSGLTTHVRVHTGEKPYRCKICGTRFRQNTSLTQHMRVHTGKKPYQCKTCDAKFATNGHLTRHMIVHMGEKPYQCKICDARFATNSCLSQHVKVHTGEKPYQCKICDASFATNGYLTQHERVHTGEKPYQCKICDASFATNGYLSQHERVHTGEKPYQCKICDAKFARNSGLEQHVRRHTGVKPYQCKICDARFAQKSTLTTHVRVHTGEKPYQCKICDARFTTSFYLTQHVRVHTGEKPYQCKICGASFATNGYLTQHVRVHTGEKPYQCKVCDAKFARNSGLEQHVRRHTGVKRYQCKICDARFAQKSTLTSHVRLHTGEKHYKCKICDERFVTYGYLTRHKRVHEGEKHS